MIKSFILVLVALSFVFILFEAGRMLRLIRVSIGLVESAEPFSTEIINPKNKVLIIGDSLGVGVGAVSGTSIAHLLSKDFPQTAIKNLSVSGFKIEDGLRLIKTVNEQSFDVVIIQLGANDIVRFTELDRALSDAESLLNEAKKLSPKVIFMTSGSVGHAPLFREPLASIYSARSKKFIAGYENVAYKSGVTYINLYRSKEVDPFWKDPDTYFAKDKFHPSSEGYKVWFFMLKEVLKETL